MVLEGKTVCITGASSGIGAACVEAFAALGCRILAVARREQRLETVAADASRRNRVEIRADALDVRDRAAVERWYASLPSGWRPISVLVNNAGLARGIEPFHEAVVDDWEEMVDTNLKGLLFVTRVVVPDMVDHGAGHVIHIGSIAGHEVYPGGSVYCATKHAVAAIGRGMGLDLVEHGIRVSAVDPGMVETEFSVVRFHGDSSRAEAVYRGMQPLVGADVAEAVVYCATRPAHVNVREMVLMPAAQASATRVHRE